MFHVINVYFDESKQEVQFRIHCRDRWWDYFFKIDLLDVHRLYLLIFQEWG